MNFFQLKSYSAQTLIFYHFRLLLLLLLFPFANGRTLDITKGLLNLIISVQFKVREEKSQCLN